MQYQHAYTKGRSNEATLTDFIDHTESALLRGKHNTTVRLDCSGAFDTMQFDIVLVIYIALATE